MGDKKLYYQRKAEGRCTKCGNPLGASPSSVRCSPCHEKFKASQRSSNKQEKVPANPATDIENLTEGALDTARYSGCYVCQNIIDTFGNLCQNCLANVEFSMEDVISRYGGRCNECGLEQLEKLVLSPSEFDLTDTNEVKPHGPKLYKNIIHTPKLSPDYIVRCLNCYWEITLNFIRNYRLNLLNQHQTKTELINSSEEDEIEITNEPL